jgi:1-acyl-sn-glycerol-3-phosphate acyltransferase
VMATPKLPRIKLPKLVADVPADTSERDPAYIREMLPKLWLAASLYFRAEVKGLENIPDEAVLFVGNHSGGASAPDSSIFQLAYMTYFTVEGRPLFSLGHQIVTGAPLVGRLMRKFGVVTAGFDAAVKILKDDNSILVYPGGDVDALRPWTDRNKITFDGRQGFLKLAHQAGVKIVPVVATGGHDTFLVLNDGRKAAKTFGFDKMLRVKTLPMTLSIPWGFLPGGLPFVPFPAKIRIQVLEPIDLRERFGDDPDWDEAYDYVSSYMQVGLAELASQTLLPVVG